jgi:predicted dithiol-disulfide oxidoreductase (DUF899 family)
MSTVLEATKPSHTVTSRTQWLAARKNLLQKEKQYTHLRDELAQLRQQLPWVKVEKPYSFETPCGTHPLSDLFGDKSQLLVYHFMFGPDWEAGCPSCSMIGDALNGIAPHIAQRDVSLMLVSRAPLEKLQAFKARMGWNNLFWASSEKTDFNQDFSVSFDEAQMKPGAKPYNFGTIDFPKDEAPGLSAFARQGDDVYHTYSTYGRGLEELLGVYSLLDMAPNGRDEAGLPWPMAWVKHHDMYEAALANLTTLNVAMPKSSCGCN